MCDLHRTSRPKILAYEFVDKVMSVNDETTTRSHTTKLKENFSQIEVSSHKVGHAQKRLGLDKNHTEILSAHMRGKQREEIEVVQRDERLK